MAKRKRASLAKRPPKPNRKPTNTISHDGENFNPNFMAADHARKNNSMKRPQTAKTRKPLGINMSKPSKSRVNNFVVSQTPNYKVKATSKGIGSIMANTNGMLVPQSHMFTSFGFPHGKAPHSQYASLS